MRNCNEFVHLKHMTSSKHWENLGKSLHVRFKGKNQHWMPLTFDPSWCYEGGFGTLWKPLSVNKVHCYKLTLYLARCNPCINNIPHFFGNDGWPFLQAKGKRPSSTELQHMPLLWFEGVWVLMTYITCNSVTAPLTLTKNAAGNIFPMSFFVLVGQGQATFCGFGVKEYSTGLSTVHCPPLKMLKVQILTLGMLSHWSHISRMNGQNSTFKA